MSNADAWVEKTPADDSYRCTHQFPDGRYCNAPARYRGLKRNKKYKAVVYYNNGTGDALCGMHPPKADQ